MLLPQAERRGEIQFYVAKRLPYRSRLAISFALMLAGLALQMFASGPRAGQLMGAGGVSLFAGVLLLLVKGYQNTVRTQGPAEWRPARSTEIQRILDLNARQRRWDQDFFDITCARGIFGFVVAAVGVFAAAKAASGISAELGVLVAVDGAILLLPFWLTGVRSILKKDKLIVKADMLIDMEREFARANLAGMQFLWQLQVASAKGGDGDVPRDVKAVLQVDNAPPEFLGMQMQVSINSVQGHDYPYFYCVLVGKPEMRLLERPLLPPLRKITVERDRQDDVDVVVIRQQTTKKTGYHTTSKAAAKIFVYALEQARHVTSGG